ncbi:MAG: carboxypeptidase-like regulatory domain-containing protein [Planctomycetota bacterium]
MNERSRSPLLAFILLGLVGLAALSSVLFLWWKPPARTPEEILSDEGPLDTVSPVRGLPSPTGVVAGHVLVSTGEFPASGIRVVASRTQPPFSLVPIVLSLDRVPRERPVETLAGSDGKFRIEGLEPGEFHIDAQAEFLRSSQPLFVFLAPGQQLLDQTLAVEPAGSVRGRVITYDGGPAAGARVTLGLPLNPLMALTGEWTIPQRAETKSEADGSYSFAGVPAGRGYTLTASLEGFAPGLTDGINVSPNEVSHVSVQLAREAVLTGHISGPQGRPVAGARIEALPLQGVLETARLHQLGIEWLTLSDENGRYRLDRLPAGSYRVQLVTVGLRTPESQTITLQPGDARGVSFALEKGLAVAGKVTDARGRPLGGARVTLHRKTSIFDPSSYAALARLPAVDTNARGEFEYAGLGEGHVELAVSKEGFIDERVEAAAGERELAIALEECGAIQGIVIDYAKSEVVRDFRLAIKSQRSPLDLGPFKRALLLRRARPFSSSKGEFAVQGLDPGTYTVTVSAQGLGTLSLSDVRVTAGRTTRGLKFFLRPEGWISGRVIDNDTEAPLQAARVLLHEEPKSIPDKNLAPLFAERPVFTASDGGFRLGGLDTQKVSLSVRSTGYAPLISDEYEVVAGRGTEGVVLRLRRAATLSGRVYTDSETPEPHAIVLLSFATGAQAASAIADAEGRYEMTGLGPGIYELWKVSPDAGSDPDKILESITKNIVAVTVRIEASQTHAVDIRSRTGGAGIRGRVTSQGQPVRGLLVQALGFGKAGDELGLHSSQTDADGNYALTGLTPGTWVVRVVDFDVTSMSGCSGLVYEVDLTQQAGDHTLDIELPEGEIKGRVVSRERGEALAGVSVLLRRDDPMSWPDPKLAVTFAYFGRVRTSTDGTYRFARLPPGRYALLAGGEDPLGQADALWGRTGIFGIEVNALPSEPLLSELLPAGTIKGQVRTAGDEPLEEAVIFVRTASGELLNARPDTTSGRRGQFELKGLAPGTYDLVLKAPGYALAVARQVTVCAGEETEIALRAVTGPGLDVEVRTPEGKPVTDALVSLFNAEGELLTRYLSGAEVGRVLSRSEDGIYPLGHFPRGTYRILVRSRSGQAEQTVSLEDAAVVVRITLP